MDDQRYLSWQSQSFCHAGHSRYQETESNFQIHVYGSESWTMHAHQEKRLNVFHMLCLRRILGIAWQDRVTNKVVIEKAGIPSLYTLLKQRRMRWPHSKRPFIWRTGDREKTNRTTPSTLQGRMQAWPPGTRHKLRLLGSYCHRQRCLETHSKSGVITIRRNTASKSGREKAS